MQLSIILERDTTKALEHMDIIKMSDGRYGCPIDEIFDRNFRVEVEKMK